MGLGSEIRDPEETYIGSRVVSESPMVHVILIKCAVSGEAKKQSVGHHVSSILLGSSHQAPLSFLLILFPSFSVFSVLFYFGK
jgi:hypothetical protein